MNKTQLVENVAGKTDLTKTEASQLVNIVLGAIADNICDGDGEVAIPDFGRFMIKQIAERQGINPSTKEKITIPAHEKIVFKPSDNISIYSRKHQ